MPNVIYFDNPSQPGTYLILLPRESLPFSSTSMFMHNYQINEAIMTLIMDSGRQKNLVAHDLVQCLVLPTTPHPTPYLQMF